MTALLIAMREDYVPKIAHYLREKFPTNDTTKRSDLEDAVRGSMDRASLWGVEVEWDFCRFAALDLLYGPGFDERCDWALRILSNRASPATARVDLLESYHRNYLDRADGV